MQMWSRSCALCHVDGNAGAPHTVEGLNSMPPLGYCMACERDDFLAMIDFMTAGLAPAAAGDNP
jgi:cytochrome c5